MGNYKQDIEVVCPYYLNSKNRGGTYNITCEGYSNCTNCMRFKTREQMDSFTDRFCNKYPNDCWLAKSNDKKYGLS